MTRVLAFDIGGTHIKWGLVAGGSVTCRGRTDTPRGGAERLLAALVALHDRAAGSEPPEQVGLAVAGRVDPATGIVRRMSALGIADWDIAGALAAARPQTGRAAVVVNDLTAACAGEAAGEETLAVLAFGTGVSAKMAVRGRLLTGAAGLAGEIGHQTFRKGGRRCGCGRRGCVEAYAGWGGLRRAMQRSGLAGGPAALAARAVDDSTARRLLDQALEAAGFAAATVVSALDPGVLRIGGGLCAAWGDALVQGVREGVLDRCWQGEHTRVEPFRHGEDAPLVGIARLAQAAVAR
jgi:glucokinase